MEQGIIELKTYDNMWITFMKKLSWSYTFNSSNQMANSAPHCKGNSIYIFLFWELRGLSPNFHIRVSVSYLYIPRISPHISLQQNGQTDPGNI